MISTSPELAAAFASGGEVIVRIDVRSRATGQIIHSSSDQVASTVTASSVVVDSKSSVRRSLNVNGRSDQAADPTGLWRKDLLGPMSGNEIIVYRGMMIGANPQYVQLGVFVPTEFERVEAADGFFFSLRGNDRSDILRAAPFKKPYTVNSGVNYVQAIKDLINFFMSSYNLTFLTDTTTETTPRLVYGTQENPWEKILELAEAVEMEVYFDHLGNVNIKKIPDPKTITPSMWLTANETGIVVKPISAFESLETVRNGVIVRGSAPWLITPVYGEAWDMNPASPLYRYGPLGERPEIIEKATVLSNAQAEAMAIAKLNKYLGIQEDIKFTSLVDPRIDVGDGIYFSVGATTGTYLIDTVEIPLRYDETMSLKGRRRV